MATQGVQMKFQGVQNATFDENPRENERIWAILGCAISSIARAKHGWLAKTMVMWQLLRKYLWSVWKKGLKISSFKLLPISPRSVG